MMTNKKNLDLSPKQCETSSLCNKFDQFNRLKKSDLSLKISLNDQFTNEIHNWNLCESMMITKNTSHQTNVSSNIPIYESINYCSFNATIEQRFQYQFFPNNDISREMPKPFGCVVLPPKFYRWPNKQIQYPQTTNTSAIYWSNLGVNSYQDLTIFNPGFTKNIEHFDAPNYDLLHEERVNIAAEYIPFASKIRTMLDIGAGAGSISFIMNKRYDIMVLNTVLPDFPYCEYISERGGLCIFLDSRRVLPFAKFSFDVIHHNWVFHSSTPSAWRNLLIEQNRILRPGGYLWISDGLSFAQLETIKYLLIKQLGYTILFENQIIQRTVRTTFGLNPYEVNWHAILIKPNRLTKQLNECVSSK